MRNPTAKTTVRSEEYPHDRKAYNRESYDYDIGKFLKKKLGGSKEVKIRFGITGDSGTGKSAFINAMRGLNDDDDGAAKVDVIEATTNPTEYKHPDNPMITFVDLPGIGTPNYPDLPTYCRKVSLENYDRYLIFTSLRFTKYDLELAKKVKSIGKSFFLVRTKIDDAYRAESRKRTFNEKEMLEKIKRYCFENVKDFISSEKDIFLISNYDKERWDFFRLVEAIGDA
ncbi:interferon-inducible GTPase 5-like [Paramuricea clavata]|uniref:Interferon-inducible GTPase 5-like n=1 Tax=Paramuricea clavata TaxID=317549 RepID=A0A7D9EC75_PARCT|nr:interferon-inducible GTPase 5-like [Paramuricea clavata]